MDWNRGDYRTLRLARHDRVLVLELHRPGQLNAFTVEMADELEHAFRAVNDDDSVAPCANATSSQSACRSWM